MKNHLLKLAFVLACLGFVLSGCEKDLFENTIKDTSSVSIGKINTVSINEVPFLIPQLVKYNSRYSHLLNSDSQNSHRGIEDLDLELERILEYAETNGLKSYSIAIKNQSDISDDMYFENLHIIYVDGEYKPFIARYNATDDSEKFDIATFSGRIKLFSVDKLTVGSLYFENGQKLPDPAPYNPLDGDIGIGGGGDPPSWMPDWLVSIFYHWNGNYLGSNSSSSSSSSSSGGNSGTGVYILGTGYTNVGSTTNTPTVNTSGNSGSGTNSTGVAPNEPEWTYPLTSQLAMANKIRSRLNYSNPEFEPWLENPSNLNLVDQIYFYMAEGGNDSETNNVASSALVQMIANPGVFSSMTPFIIEQQINDDGLDPCSKGVLTAIKNSQNNDVAKIMAKLGNPQSVYTTNIVPKNLGSVYFAQGLTNWTGFINSGNTHTPYNYTVQINSNLIIQGTKLGIYSTMLHEIIHAYFLSLIDDCLASNSGCQPLQSFPYVWNQYVNYINGNDPSIISSISQHNQIATNYINVIASALEEYQPGFTSQFYLDLAWGGLHETSLFSNNDPATRILTDEDRNRIDKINDTEASNLPQQEFNSFGQLITIHTPKGTPCN